MHRGRPKTILDVEREFLNGRVRVHYVYPNGDIRGYDQKIRDCDNPYRSTFISLSRRSLAFFPFSKSRRQRYVAALLFVEMKSADIEERIRREEKQGFGSFGAWRIARAGVVYGIHFACSDDLKTAQFGVGMIALALVDPHGRYQAVQHLSAKTGPLRGAATIEHINPAVALALREIFVGTDLGVERPKNTSYEHSLVDLLAKYAADHGVQASKSTENMGLVHSL